MNRQRWQQRRSAWALLCSVVLHVALLAFLMKSLTQRRELQPRPPVARIIELRIVESVPKLQPPKPPELAELLPLQKATRPQPKRNSPEKVVESVAVPLESGAPAEPVGSSDVKADSPRVTQWVPRVDALGWQGEVAPPAGRTIHNSPDELPTAAQLLAEEEARVYGRVDGVLHAELGAARVAAGAYDPRLALVRTELRTRLKQVPDFINVESAREVREAFTENLMPGLERYGTTGAPYRPNAGYRREMEVNDAIVDGVARGDRLSMEIQQRYVSAARFRDFGDGKMGTAIEAVVELKSGDSAPTVSLVSGSGLPPFDAWVLEQFQNSTNPLISDAGVSAQATRSRWLVKGTISYRRDRRKIELAKDAWYLVLMSATGLMTGNFDETTGQADYIDLRYPHYVAGVELMEAE